MGYISRFAWHFTREGRYDSFLVHNLGYPILVGSLFMALCFGSLDPKGAPDGIWVASALGASLSLLSIFMFKGSKPRASVGILTILTIYAASFLYASVPYIAYGFSIQGGLFEAVSGVTTTGMSVLSLSQMNDALLIWRAATGWYGGFLFISLFSLYASNFGLPGRYIFESGSASVDSEVYKPQVNKMAMRYGEIYLASTFVMAVLLMVAGTAPLTSISLSMSTVSTTGFMDFHGGLATLSVASRMIICVFMAITMFNFTTAFIALYRRSFWSIREDNETLYMWIWAAIIGATSFIILAESAMQPTDFEGVVNYVLSVLSIVSTTGFVSENMSWPVSVVIIMAMGAVIGGSIDSPTGGIKVARAAMALKIMFRNANEVGFPNEVTPIKFRKVNIATSLAYSAMLTIVLYIAVLIIGTIAITLTGVDMASAFYVALSAMTTTGKGLFALGTLEGIDLVTQYVMVALMIIGRLEVVPVLIVLTSGFWRDLLRGRWDIRRTLNGMRPGFSRQPDSRGRHR